MDQTFCSEIENLDQINSTLRSNFLALPIRHKSNTIIPETQENKLFPQDNTPRNRTQKTYDFGVFFDKDKFENVRPILSRIKHLPKIKKGPNQWLFNTEDFIGVMNEGKQQKRKTCKSTQTDN